MNDTINKIALPVVTALAIGAPPVYVSHVAQKEAVRESEKVEVRVQRDLDQKFDLLRSDIKDLKQDMKEKRGG